MEEFKSVTCSLTPGRELISVGAALLGGQCGSKTDKKAAEAPGGPAIACAQQGLASGSKGLH